MIYGEDIFVGYRYYEKISLPVLFPFGHGLSYTNFNLSSLKIRIEDSDLHVSLAIKNVGSVDGGEVAQVYVSRDSTSVTRAVKELKGWEKVFLKAGETKLVDLKIPLKYATSFWDESKSSWSSEEGTYRVLVGNSSQGKFMTESFLVEKTSWWKGL
jgi:beta-glucosidase